MIAIVDHGSGNLRPLLRAFQDTGAQVEVAASVDVIQRASKLVVAGRGPFGEAIRGLRDRGMVGPLMRSIGDGRPYLGIGVGLHLLFDVSYEGGQHTGLGLMAGKVIPFEADVRHPVRRQFPVPHMGWNAVTWLSGCPLLAGLRSGESFFFEHSAHAQPLDADVVVGQASYGVNFTSIVWSGQVFATQFFPEKSQEAGAAMLANFAAM